MYLQTNIIEVRRSILDEPMLSLASNKNKSGIRNMNIDMNMDTGKSKGRDSESIKTRDGQAIWNTHANTDINKDTNMDTKMGSNTDKDKSRTWYAENQRLVYGRARAESDISRTSRRIGTYQSSQPVCLSCLRTY
jgi:hypothetical protein